MKQSSVTMILTVINDYVEVSTVPDALENENESPTCESNSDDCSCEVRACNIKNVK